MSKVRIPAYLVAPPSGKSPDPPVRTRAHTLPFGEIDWPDFERLCMRLIGQDHYIEEARLYGEPGQDQGGIDILARREDSGLAVYQCRRVREMSPAQIGKCVTDFLEGSWSERSVEFGIYTTASFRATSKAERVEKERERLRALGKSFDPCDCEHLSLRLKSEPWLVDDFFGRAWVAHFNGEEAASVLAGCLDRGAARATRADLAAFYRELFHVHDAGLSLAPLGAVAPQDLRDLLVVPDLFEDVLAVSRREVREQPAFATATANEETRAREAGGAGEAAARARVRVGAEVWISAQRRAIISGEPGAGKSSLLRFLALDLLSPQPRFTRLVEGWQQPIPLWVPFGRWTEVIAAGGERSLRSLLERWLGDLDKPDLLSLYERALADRRVVLLVDGLDEWKSESSARVAFDLLRVFSSERDVRAVATTRPSAFQKLGTPPADWGSASLAGLSESQQLEVIERLSDFFDAGSASAGLAPERFLAELRGSVDLRELAAVPLTLVFLHWIRARDARLPRDRFQAYDALLDLLLAAYPARRSAAAGVLDDGPAIDEGEFRNALAALAFAVHLDGSKDIGEEEAVELLRRHLRDEELGLGLDSSNSASAARELIRDASERLGLLFQAGPKRIAFFHRSVQEHLSAVHLSRLSFDAQLRIAAERGGDPGWIEVLLSLIYMTRRPEEVDRLVETLRTSRSPDRSSPHGDPLMVEIGGGRFGCSARLSRELLEEAADDCETFARPTVVEAIAIRFLEAAESRGVSELIDERLASWMAARPWSLEGLYTAMADWPASAGTDKALVRGIFAEEVRDARAAAKAYSIRRQREGVGPGFLAAALERPLSPLARAVVLEALAGGWPNHPGLAEQLAAARSSQNKELALVAIAAAVAGGRAEKEDLEALLALGRWGDSVALGWEEFLYEALATGWPRNPRLKRVCMDDLRLGRSGSERLEHGLALSLLLAAFPQDPDVAEICVREIREERFPFVSLSGNHGAWRALATNFTDVPELVTAADEWLTKQQFSEPEVAFAALIGKTEVGKKRLLKDTQKGSFPFWAARALLDGWGLSDPEVRETLAAVTLGPNDQAASLGHLLPQIIGDHKRCGKRLLELLGDPSVRRVDLVLEGLRILGDEGFQKRAVDLTLGRAESWPFAFGEPLSVLMAIAPDDERVRKLSLQSLRERSPPLHALAENFRDDAEMRELLCELAAPLAASARARCWEHVVGTGADGTLIDTARRYPAEHDGAIASLMARTHAQMAKGNEALRAQVLEVADSELRTGDPHWESHAQAALSALLELGRLDLFAGKRFFGGEQKEFSVPLTDYLQPNLTIAAALVDRWEEVVKGLGPDYPARFVGIGGSPQEAFWEVIATVADRAPQARAAMSEYLQSQKPKLSENTLAFLARTEPRSDRLLTACLEVMSAGSTRPGAPLAAGELLAEQFGADSGVGERLLEEFRASPTPILLVAIAEGWPGEIARAALEVARAQKMGLSAEYMWRVQIGAGKTTLVLGALEAFLEAGWHPRAQFMPVPLGCLGRRIFSTPNLAEEMTDRLCCDSATPSECASYSRLLAQSVGLSEKAREHLRPLVVKPIGREIGVDLVAGSQRAVAHSLGDALDEIR